MLHHVVQCCTLLYHIPEYSPSVGVEADVEDEERAEYSAHQEDECRHKADVVLVGGRRVPGGHVISIFSFRKLLL